jgi:hypothetical protein
MEEKAGKMGLQINERKTKIYDHVNIGIESRPEDRKSGTRFFVFFSRLAFMNAWIVFGLGHACFLPNTSQFIILISSYHSKL